MRKYVWNVVGIVGYCRKCVFLGSQVVFSLIFLDVFLIRARKSFICKAMVCAALYRDPTAIRIVYIHGVCMTVIWTETVGL